MSGSYDTFRTMDAAIADMLDDMSHQSGNRQKASETICWHDWLALEPMPGRYTMNVSQTIIENFSNQYAFLVYEDCYGRWAWCDVDNMEDDGYHGLTATMNAVIIIIADDDDDTDSTATAPDAVEAPTEPLPRD